MPTAIQQEIDSLASEIFALLRERHQTKDGYEADDLTRQIGRIRSEIRALEDEAAW